MLRTVILHEFQQLMRDRVGAAALVLLAVVLAGGLLTGLTMQRKQQAIQAGVQAENDLHFQEMRAQLEAVAAGQKPKGFFFANRPTAVRYSIARPVSPLTALALGDSDMMPASAEVGLFSSPATRFQKASIDNPQNQQIGRFDTAFVLIYVLPLLLLVVTYNLLSIERERGTLPLLLNQPPGLLRILLSKALVPFLALAVPAALVPVIVILVASPGAADYSSNLLLFVLLTLGYSVFWIAAALLVNVLGFRSSTNALLLGGLWLALVLVLPATLQAALNAVYPLPSRIELVSQARVAEVEHNQKRKEITDRFYQDHPDLVPPGGKENRTLGFYAISLETQKAVQPVYSRFERQLDAQQAWVRRLQYLSPAVIFREGLAAAAGTHSESIVGFRERIDSFHAQVRDFVLPKVVQSRELTLADYAAAPAFPANARGAGRLPWPSLLGLLLPAAILLYWSSRRAASIESIFLKG
jgi:ABC-2 type transport system permease protein